MANSTLKPIASAIGTAVVIALSTCPVVNAAENPFAMTELAAGGFLAQAEHGKCGTLCGGDAPKFSDKGEMMKCGSTCGEVAKCGTFCGGQAAWEAKNMQKSDGKDHEVAKCGTICAAVQ